MELQLRVCGVKHLWHFENKEYLGQLCVPHHRAHHLKVSYFGFSSVIRSEPYEQVDW